MFRQWLGKRKRRLVQLVSLGVIGEWSFYGIFRCPFAVPYIGCGNCPVIQCPGRSLWMWGWILIGLSAVLFGRVFCGWVCPGGLVSEILSMGAFFKNKINRIASSFFNVGKYLVLVISLYLFFVANKPRWAIPIRTGEFFKSMGLTFEHADPIWIYKTMAIFIALGLSIFISMFWCRFFCPTGGALELLSRFSLFRFTMNEKCTSCDQCIKKCAMETQPSEGNCVQCGDCLDTCKLNAVKWRSRIRST